MIFKIHFFAVIGWVALTIPFAAMAQDMMSTPADAATAETVAVISPAEPADDEAMENNPAQPLEGQLLHDFRDARMVALEENAQVEISDVLAEIDTLDKGGDEPALQWTIEKIKLDAEIARLKILLEDAEALGKYDQVDAIQAEIDHLATLDEPVIGTPREQPDR